jgi:DNA-binding transcriptional LysR family regulator
MRLSFRQLEILQIVMDTYSATETARTLNITQSAVSQTIKEIEAYLSIRLFFRKGSQLHPTPEAIELAPYFDSLTRDVTRLEQRVNLLRGADAGLISIAGMSTMSSRILPDTIARFKSYRPDVRFQLEWQPAGNLRRQVKDEKIDMAVMAGPVDDPALTVEPLWRLPLVCISPSGHRFDALKVITLEDLQGESVISSTISTPPGRALRAHFGEEALQRITTIETNLSSATVQLVRRGAGVGLIYPLDFIDEATDSIKLTPLDPPIEMEIVFVFSAARPKSILLEGFIDEVRKTIADYAKRAERLGVQSVLLPPVKTG